MYMVNIEGNNGNSCFKLPDDAIQRYKLKEGEDLLYFRSFTDKNCVILRKNIG